MRLKLSFDEELLMLYELRKSSLSFGCWWEFPDDNYPDIGWRDFGATIIGWWIMALLRLLNGETKEELDFMDGPFSLIVHYSPSSGLVEVALKGEPKKYETTMEKLCKEILNGAGIACRKFQEMNIGERERRSLNLGSKELKKMLKGEQKRKVPWKGTRE